MDKKSSVLKCALYALGLHAVLNFLWTAFLTAGTKMVAESANNAGKVVEDILSADEIAQLLDRIMSSQLYIAIFSAVFGFSFLVFGAKNLSSPAKYSIHVIVNYVMLMLCSFLLFKTGSANGSATGFVGVLFLVSMAFFAIYGIGALIAYFVSKKLK